MDSGYPLQMDFSLSSSSKRFWDLWSVHGHWFFAFWVLHSQWLVWGEILRGELSGMERVKWRRFVCIFEHECVWDCFSGPFGRRAKNPQRGLNARAVLRSLTAPALLRSPLILPTWTLVHHNLHANRLSQYAKIIQPAQDWQWSRKSLNSQGKIPPQTQIKSTDLKP